MLVLTRKPNQSLMIGDDVVVNVIRVRGNTVQLGIEAPKEINIMRNELLERKSTPSEGEDSSKGSQQDSETPAPLDRVKDGELVLELVTAV